MKPVHRLTSSSIVACLILALAGLLSAAANPATTYTFTSSGTWVCPPGVTNVQVECWGGGGAGGSANNTSTSGHCSAGGGGGGAYTINFIGVTPGTSYTITVGAAGASTTSAGNSGNGGTSSFISNSIVLLSANGGIGGTNVDAKGVYAGGGAGGAAFGSGTSYVGGAGGLQTGNDDGTGGGSGAGPGGVGEVGGSDSNSTGGTAPVGGGSGGAGATTSGYPGTPGSFPGGGGGGGRANTATTDFGGAGAGGEIAITLTNTPFAFTPGSLVVWEPADASLNNTPLDILELSNNVANQTFAFTIGINGTNNNGMRISGSAGTVGYLADSGDGTLLAFAGANTNITSIAVNSITNRGVGTLNASANYLVQTTYSDTNAGATSAQPRGACTIDDTNWVIADQSGMYTNKAVNAQPVGNFRAVKTFGGTNYFLSAAGGNPVVMNFTGGTTNYMNGILPDSNANDYYLISSGHNGSAFDVLYVIDTTNSTLGYIYKYSNLGGTWTIEGTNSTVSGWGLCAATNGSGGVNLYFTTGSGTNTANSVMEVTDGSAWNANISLGAAATLYTAPAGALLKGVAFAPMLATASLALTSSENPSGFHDNINFTANLSPTRATGTVVFETNSVLFDTETLTAGVATSLSITNLPRGTNLITAIYSGDSNYLPATNTLKQVVTNHPPIASNVVYTRNTGISTMLISISNLLTNVTDADGDTVSLVGTGVSTNGITLMSVGMNDLGYYNTTNVNDQFSYTVTDGYGGTNTALVNIMITNSTVTGQVSSVSVSGSTATVNFAGIPGDSYSVDRSTNLTVWSMIWTTNAPANGLFQFTDGSAPMPSAYYRLQWNP